VRITVNRIDWPFKSPFRIAYRVRTHAQAVLVEIEDAGISGRGEALGVSYHAETADSLREQINSVAQDLRNDLSREDLQKLLPPGGARNAIDCALWDLEAKRAHKRAWDLAGIKHSSPLHTHYTLGLDTPSAMRRAAADTHAYRALKVKLGGGRDDVERVRGIREIRPDAELTVDVNQAWDEAQLREFTPQLAELGVKLIEQPLPIGKDDALATFSSPIPLCADESCQTTECLPRVLGKYQYVNIKLDKTGGLTEALRMARAARAANLQLMVGSMGGSSLSMAPAFIVAQLCSVIDLDGPLWSAADVPNPMRYEGGNMFAPEAELWG
jgi:L-Ala-D/L-Glu epimerase